MTIPSSGAASGVCDGAVGMVNDETGGRVFPDGVYPRDDRLEMRELGGYRYDRAVVCGEPKTELFSVAFTEYLKIPRHI